MTNPSLEAGGRFTIVHYVGCVCGGSNGGGRWLAEVRIPDEGVVGGQHNGGQGHGQRIAYCGDQTKPLLVHS